MSPLPRPSILRSALASFFVCLAVIALMAGLVCSLLLLDPPKWQHNQPSMRPLIEDHR